jgi:hypothetical protein
MNEGVKILLARMETHPEEFYVEHVNRMGNQTKWNLIWQLYKEYLDPKDVEAFNQVIDKIHQQRFTELVISELLDPHEDAQQELSLDPYKAQILPSSSITYTSEPLINRKPTVKVRKPTTTGKLFNYT